MKITAIFVWAQPTLLKLNLCLLDYISEFSLVSLASLRNFYQSQGQDLKQFYLV